MTDGASRNRLSFEEFKLYYESTEKVTDRRLDTNRWNYSICVAILIAIATITKWTLSTPGLVWVGLSAVAVLSMMATLFCQLWIGQIRDFKKLNNAKFGVLNEMAPYLDFDTANPGTVLSYCPFDKEWKKLEALQALEEVGRSNIGPSSKFRSQAPYRCLRLDYGGSGLDQYRYSVGKNSSCIAATVVLVVALLAGIAWWQRNEAQEQARIAESRRLAAESTSALTQYPQRSLLLAVEAAKLGQSLPKGWGAAAEESLRAALAFVGGRPLVTSPSAIISIGISQNNRWLVVESLDGTGWLWNLTAKDPAARPVMLHGLKGEVTALAISLDSHWLVTGGVDKTARLWDHPSQNR